MQLNERQACISGVGQSDIGRPLTQGGLELTLDACLNAIEDAGLTRADIDGISTWPGNRGGTGVGVLDVKESLRLELEWFCGGGEGAAQFSSILNAVHAVCAGFANHILCFRTVTEAQDGKYANRTPGPQGKLPRVSGAFQEPVQPYWSTSAANWIGWFATRHMHDHGVTQEQLAQIALNGRKNAEINPKAIYRDPLTMDDYMASRMISTPFRLFDCDVPIDGSTAVVVSRTEVAKDLRKPPLRFEAISGAISGRHSWTQREDLATMASHDVGPKLWERTDLKPKDMDLACLYDGFSYITLLWLEALGFCGTGESGAFVEGGERIARDGELPLNPHGGQLSAGRMHGFGFAHEAAIQLWGEGGERQIANDPKIAIAAVGGGPIGSAFILVRD